MASERSVTMSDRRVVSQYHSFVTMLGGSGAIRPTSMHLITSVFFCFAYLTLYQARLPDLPPMHSMVLLC